MTWTCIEQREQVHKGHGGNRVIRKLIFTEIFIDNVTVDVLGHLKPLSDMEIKSLAVSHGWQIIFQLVRNNDHMRTQLFQLTQRTYPFKHLISDFRQVKRFTTMKLCFCLSRVNLENG